MKKHKKDLGSILQSKKSWKRVLRHLHKYLDKYGGWDYTYEFDKGTVRIDIQPYNDCSKVKRKSTEDLTIKKERKSVRRRILGRKKEKKKYL